MPAFVRNGQDVWILKNYIASKNGHQKVVAKIENLQAIEHLDEIIAAADGIVIARGDLSIEVPLRIFLFYKKEL